MLGSLMNILGSPQVFAADTSRTVATVASNVTVDTMNTMNTTDNSISSQSTNKLPNSNSTALDFDGSDRRSSDESNNFSTSSSPGNGKLKRENSSSDLSSSYASDQNVSTSLKHDLDLDDPFVQKTALRYLIDKVRVIEGLLFDSANENKLLRDEVSALYKQNDALSAENVTMQQEISDQKETNILLANEISSLKETFAADNDLIESAITNNAKEMKKDIEFLECEVKYLADSGNTLVREVKEEIRGSIKFNNDKFVRLEKDIASTNQYNRRENLIIDGVPGDVPQNVLEQSCLNIIRDIGFHIGPYEVVACHRLRKKEGDATPPVIIRFMNRKVTEYCLKNQWRLKYLQTDWALSFREDLCEANLVILNQCEKLKSDGHISKVFTHRGFVKIVVVKKNKNRTFKVTHESDIDKIISTDD